MAFALTEKDLAKKLLDDEATGFIRQTVKPEGGELQGLGGEIKNQFIEGMTGDYQGEQPNLRKMMTGDYQGEQPNLREMMTGDYQGEEQAFLGDLWNNLKEKYKENQNWEPTYPTQPENLRQRDLEKEYPDLRKEPQKFSKKDVNRKVAEVVGQTAQKLVEDNPGLAGLNNDYIADGTNGRMAQQIFERPDADRNLSDEEFIELLKRLGVDSSPWGGDDSIPPKEVLPGWATDGRTWEA